MNILHLAFQTGLSKKLKRTGWVIRNVNNPESVAEHAFRVTILSSVLAASLKADREKLIKMSIIHDLGEISTGDVVVESWTTIFLNKRKKKEEIEKRAIKEILSDYGEEYSLLFHEMIKRKTNDAKIFWDIDLFERTIQAYEYEKEQNINMEEFFVSAKHHLKHPLLLKAFKDLENIRLKKTKPRNEIIKFALHVGKSKKIKRTGWVKNRITEPESIAEHCFILTVLAMTLAPSLDVNQHKLIKMALIHDLEETATGDLIVEKGKFTNTKKRKEKEKIEKKSLKTLLFGFGENYEEIFQEMIERKTRESNIFWQIDKFEMATQAYNYEKNQNKDMSEFFNNAEKYISHPLLKKAFEDLKRMRVR